MGELLERYKTGNSAIDDLIAESLRIREDLILTEIGEYALKYGNDPRIVASAMSEADRDYLAGLYEISELINSMFVFKQGTVLKLIKKGE